MAPELWGAALVKTRPFPHKKKTQKKVPKPRYFYFLLFMLEICQFISHSLTTLIDDFLLIVELDVVE